MTPLENELLDALRLSHAIIRGRHSAFAPKALHLPPWAAYRLHSPEIQLIEATLMKAEPLAATATNGKHASGEPDIEGIARKAASGIAEAKQ